MKKLITLFLICLLNIGVSSIVFSDDTSRKLAIGLGYPYVSLKYRLGSKLAIEGLGAFEEGITIAGGRLYYHFNPHKKFVIYTGVEYDTITFEEEDILGTGNMSALFLGFEYFMHDKLSLIMDLDAAYVNLVDSSDVNIDLGEMGFLFNIGFNFYLK